MILRPSQVVNELAPHISLSADHIASAGGSYEPQRAYNWVLVLNNSIPGAEQIRLACASAFLPSQSNEVIEIKYGNEIRKVAGGIKFEDGELKVRDYVDPDIYGFLRQWQAMVSNIEAGQVGFASEYKKTARIILSSGDTTVTREYQLTGLWPSKLAPEALSYDDQNKQLEITMTLTYDRALPA
jgi:hypothetical protein